MSALQNRTNSRNGYRHQDFDTRAGTLDVAIPKLRSGSYFPDWLLQRRKRAERALTSVVLAFFRSLVARGLSGVRLVTSDAHAGLVSAIAASPTRSRRNAPTSRHSKPMPATAAGPTKLLATAESQTP